MAQDSSSSEARGSNGPDVRFISQLTSSTYGLILAGGRGSRLGPLTDWRAKPAVPFGGKFRIIDFALSNCLNSGIRRIGIATQYKSHSLIRHLQRGWSLPRRALQRVHRAAARAAARARADWYQGTADAVYQNLDILRRHDPRLRPGARRRPRLQDGLRAHARRARRHAAPT